MHNQTKLLFAIVLPDNCEGEEPFDGSAQINQIKRETTRRVNEVLIAIQDFYQGFDPMHPDTNAALCACIRYREVMLLMEPIFELIEALINEPLYQPADDETCFNPLWAIEDGIEHIRNGILYINECEKNAHNALPEYYDDKGWAA